MAKALGEPISQISYHLRALESYGTTREVVPVPGEDLLMHESAVSEHAEILTLLEATEADDEGETATTARSSTPVGSMREGPRRHAHRGSSARLIGQSSMTSTMSER